MEMISIPSSETNVPSHRTMKVTFIVGSARSNGSCAILLDSAMSELEKCGADCVKFCVGEEKIAYCCGCKRCYADGRCTISEQDPDDRVLDIVKRIIESDVVMIAAPSYWAGVPGQCKTFFDRCTPYGDTNPRRIILPTRPIKGIAVAVRAGVRDAENELILDSLRHWMGHLGIETVKRVSVTRNDTTDDLMAHHGDVIELMKALGRDIGRGNI